MSDIQLFERVVESSPVIVIVLAGACIILWRTLREEIASCRHLHAQSIETHRDLKASIDLLAERIGDSR